MSRFVFFFMPAQNILLSKRQFDESKKGINDQAIEDDEISFETDITSVNK